MGHFTKVYGYIYALGGHDGENAARIAALPETDTWPYLTRDLFAVPNRQHIYWDQLITFGSLYNGVERAWETWLSKFEALLRTMDWDEAHVFLETELWGSYHYVWEPLPYDDQPDKSAPLPIQRWKFSGGPRSNIREAYRAT
jgi:hypothetical protein